MQRTLVLAAIAALALAAAPAVAKEITKAEVCGAGGCATVDDEAGRAVLMNGGPPRTPPTAAPYYNVRMEMAHGGEEVGAFNFAAVPEQRAFRADDGAWYEMPPEMAALITKVAAGKRAFPAAGLIGAAAAPEPRPQAADAGSPLWPEGVLVALVLIGAGVILVRAARASGRFRAASS
jgi:hypothetical protein